MSSSRACRSLYLSLSGGLDEVGVEQFAQPGGHIDIRAGANRQFGLGKRTGGDRERGGDLRREAH